MSWYRSWDDDDDLGSFRSGNPDGSFGGGCSGEWWSRGWGRWDEAAREAVKPLLKHLTRYDAARCGFERGGGRLTALAGISALLEAEIDFGDRKGALADPAKLKHILGDLPGSTRIHLQVRRSNGGFPLYYLCRKATSWDTMYSLIVEDFFISQGFPMPDERFCCLMSQGSERNYLRLGPMRKPLQTVFPGRETDHQWLDRQLYKAGRTVFQSAWHEDQKAGVLVGSCFGIPALRPAIELLYFALSADLCSIRPQVDEESIEFFMRVFPHDPIRRFLQLVPKLSGTETDGLPQKILPLYSRLSREFGQFLRIPVRWGRAQQTIPLYKLIFGNFNGRLAEIGIRLKPVDDIREGIARLEEEANAIITEILEAAR